ncbi:RNA polymerase III transcription initiation factor complex subunit [Pseudocyphellaria aurata]|nr:RNA polymerase III transcription initiation factor complex subunit [Pseudocyphellaria aurata]
MVKSFDDLISYLLEAIALYGHQGARPSDILKSIDAFYAESSHSFYDINPDDSNKKHSQPKFNSDRSFQERVWQWLVRHPECRVGKNGQGNNLTLSEAEALSNIPLQPAVPANGTVILHQDVPALRSQRSIDRTFQENPTLSKPIQGLESTDVLQFSSKDAEALRLYTSEDRMWHALTGHGVDLSKIPQLEFTCLCIIAAHGPKGVMQPGLVKISGQDKRSVPRRTQRLCDNGYIIKRPIQADGSRTSVCILKRFVPESNFHEGGLKSTDLTAEPVDQSSQSIMKQCFHDGQADLYALSRIIFDILNEKKLIAREDLKARLGVSSLRRERRIVGIFLRKLAALGCIKQVKALDNTPRPSLRYFRCVKLVREPGEKESQKLLGLGYGKIFPVNAVEAEDMDSEDDDIDDNQPEEMGEFGTAEDDRPGKILQEVDRPIPQWTGHGCVFNLVHDLVQRAGTQGMSTTDIKWQAFGKFMLRPIEHQLTRLVEFWQISQPLHLRHLALLRDTALTHRTSHYVHYTYENFQRMVERGDASWEAVATIAKGDKRAKGSTVTVDAEPKLDEYGFPILQTTLFQGRENDATLSQCCRALNLVPIPIKRDLVAKRQSDGTYGIENAGGLGKTVGSRPPPAVRSSDPVDKSRPTGRPRKIPRSGLPKGLTPGQLAKYKQSQQAAARYQKMKAEKEISKRISVGQDPPTVRQNVYSELCARYVEEGEEIPPILKEMLDQVMMPIPAHESKPSSPVSSREVSEVVRGSGYFDEKFPYLPSIAAHTQQFLPLNVRSTSLLIQGKEVLDPPENPTSKTGLLSLPSVAAHSGPYLTSWHFSLDIPVPITQRERGRSAKPKIQTMSNSSSPEAAQSELDAMSPDLPSDTLSLKRKRSYSNNPEISELPSFQQLPIVTAHTLLLENEQEFSMAQPNVSPEHSLDRPSKKQRLDGGTRKSSVASKSHALKEKSYEELSHSISRGGPGVFVGEHALRARAKGQRGRTKYTRLAIFQSTRLNELTWFSKEANYPEKGVATTISNNQGILLNSVASCPNSPSIAEPEPYLHAVSTSSQPPPDPEHWINRTSPSKVSSHLDRDALHAKPHTGPDMDENGYNSHEPTYNRTSSSPSSRTSTPGACATTKDLQTSNLAVPSLAPSISGFTPINRAGVGRATKALDPQKSTDPKATNYVGTPSARISGASFKVPLIDPLQSTEELQGDGSSVSSSSQEPEIIGADLEMKESRDTSIANNLEPERYPPNESRSNRRRSKPLDTATNSSAFSQPTNAYPNGPEISETAPVAVNELCSREASVNSLHNLILDSCKENRTPTQGSASRSLGSDSCTPSKEVPNTRTRKAYQSTSFRQVAAGGGSVGVLRRKIIMDIIESCGGVYPGVRELLSPFVTAWMKLDRSGRPDARTVQTAFNYLVCQSCKLRAVTFTFRTAKGVMVTKTMATLTHISPTDQKVKDMQQNMIAAYPAYYFPAEAELSEETKSSGSYLTRYGRHTSVKDLEFEKDNQVQLQHKPAFDLRLEQKQARAEMRSELSKARHREARAIRLAETGLLGGLNIGMSMFKRRTRAADFTRKVERLASIRKRPEIGDPNLTAGLSSGGSENYSMSMIRDLSMDPAGLADPEVRSRQNLQKRPRSSSSTLEYRHDFDEQVLQDVFPATSQNLDRRVDSNMADTYDPTDVFWNPQLLGTVGVHEDTASVRENRRGRGTRHSSDFRRTSAFSRGKYRHRTGLEGSAEEPVSFLPMRGVLALPTQYKRRRLANVRDTAKSFEDVIDPALREYHPVSTLMNPHHVFHQATGTFSVDFCGPGNQDQSSHSVHRKKPIEEAKPVFITDVVDLLKWELYTEDLPDAVFCDWPFINHQFTHPHETPSEESYKIDTDFEMVFHVTNGRMEKPPRTAPPHLPRPRIADSTFTKGVARIPPATREMGRGRKRQDVVANLKTRSLTAPAGIPLEAQHQGLQKALEPPQLDGRPQKLRRIRGPYVENRLSADDEKRLFVAVMVIRTLTGGVEKNIDWVLVARLFQPKHSQFYIQKRWTPILHKFRLQIDQLQARFQMNFVKAYQDGIIPKVDFDKLEEYDWAWLVDWTLKNIDTPKESLPDLPAKRSDLDCFFNLQQASDDDMAEYYEIDTTSVLQRREAALNRRAQVYPSEPMRPTLPEAEAEAVAVAKSWIRANVLTPEASYHPDLARAKLSSIEESTVDVALKELLTIRLLSQQNKGRLIPGRNYDISEYFLSRFRKKLEPSHFHRAVAYKRELDESFWKHDSIKLSWSAENGDVMAVMNMLAHGRLMVKPKNPPINKFGFTNGGYQTRRMDKSLLNFEVELRIRPTYITGNPLSPLPPLPCAHLQDPMAKIPLWYDIHGNPVHVMWELALAAVLTILSKRPGVAAETVLMSVKPSLDLWELELMLEWMVQAKAVKKAGTGYGLDEWWWMCLGEGGMACV